MEIADYRGYHAKLAEGRQGEVRRMMAVALSYSDSEAFVTVQNLMAGS